MMMSLVAAEEVRVMGPDSCTAGANPVIRDTPTQKGTTGLRTQTVSMSYMVNINQCCNISVGVFFF